MSIKSVLVLISLIHLFVWINTQRGSYPALNPTGCGLSRLSIENDSQCFEWHNNGVTSGQMRNGMNVTAGVAPWLVIIHVIIHNSPYPSRQVNITVYSGHKFIESQLFGSRNQSQWLAENDVIARRASNWTIHPKITTTNPIHNIALIKLSEPIPPSPLHNSICLPVEHYIETTDSYVSIASYGSMGTNSPVNYKDYPAQVTYAKTGESYSRFILETISPDGAGDQCRGGLRDQSDQGGPVWQYYMGRAVLLGVYVTGGEKDEYDCMKKESGTPFLRVSQYIDWVIHETRLDEWHINETGHKWDNP